MNQSQDMNTDRAEIERAFQATRAELGIRTGFPAEALREAEQVAHERRPDATSHPLDCTEIPFVTIDPPGSRDLDQAVHAERRGAGYRVRYAIADVGYFVDRGGALEREAWQRGTTFYAPDHREPLYPPVLSEAAASLLADELRPSVLFTLDLDGEGALTGTAVERARVRSRAQLTYGDLLEHVERNGESEAAGTPWAETLELLGEIGEKRLRIESERGGVSLPIRDQHVEQRAAEALGYELSYEEPNPAEQWNAQISLLTGHAAALRMVEAGVGLLRTVAPTRSQELREFRLAAEALGFDWPKDRSYAEFIREVDVAHPDIEVLIWQARRVMKGARYLAFHGEPPPDAEHAALAMLYSHCTAPLRRLGDRYVLDLLLRLARGEMSDADEIATLSELPAALEAAQQKGRRLERVVVNLAEAWTLRGREGESFPAVVLDVRPERIEVQIDDPPVRTRIERRNGLPPVTPGDRIEVRLRAVETAAARVDFELVS
ncbi:MAG: RNB domain-containing ribonuclease [Gemmatimonadota bacterium]|nr:RNB domain-containing ribonuclease [Gemmatimonadota bacterium]